jgi:hypothetical protein
MPAWNSVKKAASNAASRRRARWAATARHQLGMLGESVRCVIPDAEGGLIVLLTTSELAEILNAEAAAYLRVVNQRLHPPARSLVFRAAA